MLNGRANRLRQLASNGGTGVTPRFGKRRQCGVECNELPGAIGGDDNATFSEEDGFCVNEDEGCE